MESILTKISNVPQSSAHDYVNFADGQTWAAGTYYRPVYIPVKARVSDVVIVLHDKVGATSGTNTIEVGYFAGTAQETLANQDASGAADPNAFFTTMNLEGTERVYKASESLIDETDGTQTQFGGKALMCMPPTSVSEVTYEKDPNADNDWILSSAGEKKVAVVAKIVLGDAQTAGALFWWVEYRFDANITWEQSAL